MQIQTHQRIDRQLCGTPIAIQYGCSKVELKTTEKMIADDTGLVHGGFIFGLADYAAMLAVNHPYVVLGGAAVRFIKPVQQNQTLIAEATITHDNEKKKMVSVTVSNGDKLVFEGEFTCFVLKKHVLK